MSRIRKQLREGQQSPARRVLNRVTLTLEVQGGEQGIGIHAGGVSLPQLHRMLLSALKVVEQEQQKSKIIVPGGVPPEMQRAIETAGV